MKKLSERHPEQIAVRIGYDTSLAHRIEAGIDFYVMPSRYEPCGLNQLYSLRYGAVPIVHSTGGLVDSVNDLTQGEHIATGIKFADCTSDSLGQAIERALALYSNPDHLFKVRDNGMRADFSWRRATTEYDRLYNM